MDLLKQMIISVLIFLSVLAIVFFSEINKFVSEINYYENGIKIDAIEYNNEIYLKKGE